MENHPTAQIGPSYAIGSNDKFKEGKFFPIEMMPRGICRHSFDMLPHGKHRNPIICYHVKKLNIQ
jgi:hypothetical protein